MAFLVPAILLFGLEFLENGIQALEITFPDFAVAFEPVADFGKGLGFDAARAALGVAAAGDKAGAFEDAKVLGDGRLRHVEGLGEFVDRGIAENQAGQDSAARGVGESGEGGVESVGGGHGISRA